MKVLVALLLIFILTGNVIASSYGYPWKGSIPILLTIKNHVSSSWASFVQQATLDWSLSPVVDVIATASDNLCSPKGKITICDGYYGLGNQHVAWTVFTARRGTMVDAAIYLNNSYTDGYINANGIPIPPYTDTQKAHLVCHEIGHAMGILTEGICSENGAWVEHPTQIDYDRLLDIYTN